MALGLGLGLPYVFGRGVGGPMGIDLFLIAGQSNAEGRGDSSLSPDAPNGRYISGSTITSPLADPVGGASTGSMWPAFSNEWYAQTGRLSAFVESATGGTALLPDTAGTNWSPSGSLRAGAVAAANTAIAAISASPDYSLGNVYFVWSQGEQDAANGATSANYEAALEAIAAYFKAQVPQMVTMGVVQTGWDANTPSSIAAYAEIRSAQDAACTDSANLAMLYRGTHSFWAANPLRMSDSVHYTQDGYNLAGKCAARELVIGPSAIPAAPAVVVSTAYADASYSSKSSRTVSHTTNAGTHALYVPLVILRNDTNAAQTVGGVTFNGVAMTEVGNVSAAGGVGLGYARVALYRLDETAYGGSLAGVTANLVVSASGGAVVRMIDFAVYETDKVGIADYIGKYNPSPANVASASAVSTSNAPGLWITVGASCAAGGTPLTATFTGATEVMDHGLANSGATRVGQMVVGHSSEALTVNKSVSINWGTSCETMAIATFVLRGKISGE